MTSNYGYGMWFKPFKLLPLAAGRALLKDLEALRALYRTQLKNFNDVWDQKVWTLLPEAKPDE